MSKPLTVAILQTTIEWENPSKNLKVLQDKINTIPSRADLVILPEMFTSGFTMNAAQVAETMTGKTIAWLKALSKAKDVAIMGSLIISKENTFFNRLVFVEPSGVITSYDKRHTFTLAGEHNIYKSGSKKVIINYKGWSICPLICYDLRFPVWARNTENYDLLIYVANWPKVRISAWDTLLKARAIENMSYCIGVNRVGLDGNDYEYTGHSAAYDVLGYRLDTIPEGEDCAEVITLYKADIKKYREKLGFLKDKDTFTLKV